MAKMTPSDILHFCTGTLCNQKHNVRSKTSTSQCPFFHHSDSACHILSICQHRAIFGVNSERHNIACRLIMKVVEAGSLGPILSE